MERIEEASTRTVATGYEVQVYGVTYRCSGFQIWHPPALLVDPFMYRLKLTGVHQINGKTIHAGDMEFPDSPEHKVRTLTEEQKA